MTLNPYQMDAFYADQRTAQCTLRIRCCFCREPIHVEDYYHAYKTVRAHEDCFRQAVCERSGENLEIPDEVNHADETHRV